MNYQQALKILSLSHPPSPAEVKKSYRRLALQHHPDRNENNPSAVKLFRECTEAYNYLLENIGQWVGTQESHLQSVAVEDLENIFDDIFGFTREDRILGYQEPQVLLLTLTEFAFGAVKELKLTAYEKCETCHGSGAAKGTHAIICTHCFGSGRIKSIHEEKLSFKVCPKCFGKGRNLRQPCQVCRGFGRSSTFKKQRVKIPAGLPPREMVTLHSTDVKTGKNYDLFILPQLIPHSLFTVEKCDLLCEYPLNEELALRGGMLEMPTLWGWAALTIAPGTKNGTVQCLKEGGFPLAPGQKQRGDLNITLKLISQRLFKKESALFLRKVSLGNPHYPSPPRSFLERLFNA